MKTVSIPIVDGKYRALFPEKCVYCGAPKEMTMRQTVSAGRRRRRRFVTVDVPYCAEHARESKRNARVLTVGLVTVLLTSCCTLFGITTSINRTPPTWLLVFLALIATTIGTALAIPISFMAARNLMGNVVSPFGSIMAGLLVAPVGGWLGLQLFGWLKDTGDTLAQNTLLGLAVLVVCIAAAWLLS